MVRSGHIEEAFRIGFKVLVGMINTVLALTEIKEDRVREIDFASFEEVVGRNQVRQEPL